MIENAQQKQQVFTFKDADVLYTANEKIWI